MLTEAQKEYYRQWKAKKLAEDPEYFRRYERQRPPRKRKGNRNERRKKWEAAHRDQLREQQRAWRQRNPERVRELRRARYFRHREEINAKAREAYASGGAKARERVYAYKNTLQQIARRCLNDALRYGHIVKPDVCQCCGNVVSRNQLQGHHGDYLKPLDVLWVCTTCHGKLHRRQ